MYIFIDTGSKIIKTKAEEIISSVMSSQASFKSHGETFPSEYSTEHP